MTEVKLNRSIDLSIPVKKVQPNKHVKKEPKNNRPRVKTAEEIKQNVINALEKVGGKYVHFDDLEHTEGLLIAGAIDTFDGKTNPVETICFVVMDKDRNIQYINNNEHFTVLREPTNNLSVLDYLYHREPQYIKNRADAQLESDGVEVFTNNYIYIPTQKKNNRKKNTKKH